MAHSAPRAMTSSSGALLPESASCGGEAGEPGCLDDAALMKERMASMAATTACLESYLEEGFTSRCYDSFATRDDYPSEEQSEGSLSCSDGERAAQSAFHLHYQVLSVLGAGTCGRVYKVAARDEEGDHTYAAKVTDMTVESADRVEEEYCMLRIMAGSRHVIQVVDAYWEGPLSYIITERCTRSFARSLERRQVVSERTMAFYFRQAFEALAAVHAAGITHRDVKPDNLMVAGEEEIVKLIDFGLSLMAPDGGACLRKPKDAKGTPPYMSPEMVRGDGYGQETDVWSLGVSVYACMLGDFPYNGLQQTSAVMKAAIRLGLPAPSFRFCEKAAAAMGPAANVSAEADDFLRAALQRRPSERLTAAEALEHPWLAGAVGLSYADLDAQGAPDVDLKAALTCAGNNGAFSRGRVAVARDEMDDIMYELQLRAAETSP